MRKLLLTSIVTLAVANIGFAATNNTIDTAQARPDSTIKAEVYTEVQKTTDVVSAGKVMDSATEISVTPSSETVMIESPVKSLQAPTIVDDKLDLEDTMKQMGKNFKKLKSADSLAAMAEPATELAKWASQAQALGLDDKNKLTAEDKEKFQQGMQTLRKQIADLEIAIESNDRDGVQVLLNEMNDTRKQGHKYFDVK
ncbi:cytochrome b562 [Suttonella ornithocola]|uniref:Soluble cytochrome b562 n=1 Tax=Suttonella ornithocola TaxID=279832 RepID=A0A380MVU2_9GAMM|nr:cytochrome b562 [Suttonella ornithocola]SUO96033.1 Soluble cytochrome b562 [Suttonella ornithocola]